MTQNPLSEADRQMFAACSAADVAALTQALDNGADVFARQEPGMLEAGKSAMHVAAKRGFTEGVVLLRDYGLDVDYPDEPIGNTALHILPDVGKVDMFRQLIEMGADVHAKNHKKFDVETSARHMDKVNGSRRFSEVLDHFKAMPSRDDFAELTLDAVLKPGKNGFCMLDNPAMLMRIDEMGKALADSGTPLTLATLEQESADGRSYLEKLMMCDKLRETAGVLRANGEQLLPNGEGTAKGEVSPRCEQMIRWRQLGAVFNDSNWKGHTGNAMMHAYMELPEEGRAQVHDIHQLRSRLDAAQNKGYGRNVG